MLTEPLTAPTTRLPRLAFAALVGFLFAPNVHIGSFYFTPELALLASATSLPTRSARRAASC